MPVGSKLAEAYVQLRMQTAEFNKDLQMAQAKVKTSVDGIQKKLSSIDFKKIGMGMTVAGGAITGALALATKSTIEFNKELANVATLIPKNTARVEELKSGIQTLATEVGKSTTDLTQGLYQVISAFGDSSASMGILEIAAKGATAGVASTTDAINLLSAVTKGYGDTSLEAVEKVSDLAFQTVKMGQTTFPELAGSIGRVTPLAATLGVSMEELFAVMATGTGVTGTASEVSTQLRGILQSLLSPTADMAELMQTLGYESGQAMIQQEGLSGALQIISDAAVKSGQPLQKYISQIEGQTLALALTGTQADTYIEKLEAMRNSAGLTEEAFREQAQGINETGFAFEQTKQQMIVLAQKIGDELLPILLPLAKQIAEIIEKITGWAKEHPKITEAVTKFAAVLGPLMVAGGPLLMLAPTFSAIAAALPGLIAAFAPLLGPMGIIMGIAAGVALLYKAWTENWGGIQEKTKAVINFLKDIPDKVIRLFKGIINWFKNNWILFFGPAGLVYKAWTENWGGIQDKVGEIVEAIKKPFLNIGEKFRKFGNEAFGKAKGFLKGITGWQTQIENEVAKYGKAIIDYFKSLPGKVFKAGQEIIMKWVDGIKGAVDKVKQAGGWIAGKLADFIGHSLPKEGPLAHPERGGKSIVEAWLEGIGSRKREVEQAGKDMGDNLKDGLQRSLEKQLPMWEKFTKEIKKQVGDMFESMKESARDYFSRMENWLAGTVNLISEVIKGEKSMGDALLEFIYAIPGVGEMAKAFINLIDALGQWTYNLLWGNRELSETEKTVKRLTNGIEKAFNDLGMSLHDSLQGAKDDLASIQQQQLDLQKSTRDKLIDELDKYYDYRDLKEKSLTELLELAEHTRTEIQAKGVDAVLQKKETAAEIEMKQNDKAVSALDTIIESYQKEQDLLSQKALLLQAEIALLEYKVKIQQAEEGAIVSQKEANDALEKANDLLNEYNEKYGDSTEKAKEHGQAGRQAAKDISAATGDLIEKQKAVEQHLQEQMKDLYELRMRGEKHIQGLGLKFTELGNKVGRMSFKIPVNFDVAKLRLPSVRGISVPVRFNIEELNLPKFQTGIPYVPETMPAILHKGERVIPASQNNPARLGFGDIHIPVRMNIQNVNTRADEEELVDVVRGAIRKEIDERLRRP